MATFRVAGTSEYLAITGWGIDDVKLAKKAWVWLGQSCTTLDAAPASYEVEVQGVTADKFPVVLRAVCIVGPKTEDEADPLLLRANNKATGLSVQVQVGHGAVGWSSKAEVNLSVATKMAGAQSKMAGAHGMMAGAQGMMAGAQSNMAVVQIKTPGAQIKTPGVQIKIC